jgi:Tol biopolymer transport system component
MFSGVWLAGLLALTACLPQGVRLPESPLVSALGRKSGLIAYIGLDGNIYTIDQGGGGQVQLTNDARLDETNFRFYGVPVWATDGEALTFAAYEGSGDDLSRNSLIVVNKDGSGLREAYQSSDYMVYYHWSPDGRNIGLLSQLSDTLALKVVPTAGGEAQIVDTGAPFYWDWAPDGRSVFIHAGGEAGRLAYLQLGESAAEVVEFSLDITPSAFKAPAFSPDGSQILVAQKGDTESALILANADGGEARILATFKQDIAFAFSPDGTSIAYLNSNELLGPISVIDPTGQREVIELDEQVYTFFWSPDSRSLAYFTVEEVTDENGRTGTISRLKVLDVASGQSRSLTQLVPTRRFLQLVPYFDQYQHALTLWSPDSQYLVFSSVYDDDEIGIFVVHASGNLEPRLIADGQLGVWSWK